MAITDRERHPSDDSTRVAWPVNWSGVWVGSLASVAAVVMFGLIGTALGAHLVGPEHRVVDLHDITFATLAYSVFSAFFACVVGGWLASSIAGIRRGETAMLHGAISWLVAIPLVIALATFGAGAYLGGWYGGLAGTPSWAGPVDAPYEKPEPLTETATAADRAEFAQAQEEYRKNVRQWREDTPLAMRNSAVCALSALLVGLIGSAIGGWMASGEPLTLYYRARAESSRTPKSASI